MIRERIEESPLVSVVMPNYNGERFVSEAINTVLSQTYSNIELIVVDDCSTDNSPEIIENIARADSRVHFIRNTSNCGVSKTRNNGIQLAKGHYIAFLDNDDLWEKDKVERQLLLASKGYLIVYCSYDFIDEKGELIKKPFIVPPTTNFHKMLSSSVISCSSAFIDAELLKEHLFRTDFYHEDYLLWMELLKVVEEAAGDQKVLMHYRQVSGSRSSSKGQVAKERWKIYRKALKLNIFESSIAFLRYAINGVLKYYL